MLNLLDRIPVAAWTFALQLRERTLRLGQVASLEILAKRREIGLDCVGVLNFVPEGPG